MSRAGGHVVVSQRPQQATAMDFAHVSETLQQGLQELDLPTSRSPPQRLPKYYEFSNSQYPVSSMCQRCGSVRYNLRSKLCFKNRSEVCLKSDGILFAGVRDICQMSVYKILLIVCPALALTYSRPRRPKTDSSTLLSKILKEKAQSQANKRKEEQAREQHKARGDESDEEEERLKAEECAQRAKHNEQVAEDMLRRRQAAAGPPIFAQVLFPIHVRGSFTCLQDTILDNASRVMCNLRLKANAMSTLTRITYSHLQSLPRPMWKAMSAPNTLFSCLMILSLD